MKVIAVVLAGGEGNRLGILTAKRSKPAIPFAGKYRIIDFALSNCVNSSIFEVMIIVQYRPHSLVTHIGAGGPWDLNRDFTGGVRIFTPYKSRGSSWFVGTADAVQQNFGFIKSVNPDMILILSGDHVYSMDFGPMISYHQETKADLTMGVIQVPVEEAHRFGIVGVDENQRVTSFIEKPENPHSCLVNMGIYLFNEEFLNRILWEDHLKKDSAHDFGKDILPLIVQSGAKIYAYQYSGYWVDVGTINSYWQAHMDLLSPNPPLNLYDRSWIIHTRTEERPPAYIHHTATIEESMISDGCIIEPGARVCHSILSPGVHVSSNAIIHDSIIFTDSYIQSGVIVKNSIVDKKTNIGELAQIGEAFTEDLKITTIGKHSHIPAGTIVKGGATIGPDVIPDEYVTNIVQAGEIVQSTRLPYEL